MLEQWTLFEWLDATLKEAHRVEARANALRDEMVAALDATRHDLLASLARLQEKYLFTEDWQSETFTRKTAYLRAQREAVDALLAEVRAEIDGKVKEAAEDAIMSAGITATTMMEPIPALAPMIQGTAPEKPPPCSAQRALKAASPNLRLWPAPSLPPPPITPA